MASIKKHLTFADGPPSSETSVARKAAQRADYRRMFPKGTALVGKYVKSQVQQARRKT